MGACQQVLGPKTQEHGSAGNSEVIPDSPGERNGYAQPFADLSFPRIFGYLMLVPSPPLMLAAVTLETILGIAVVLNLIGLTFAAYVILRRK